MKEVLVEVQNISCGYGNGFNVLQQLSFKIYRNSIIGVVGESGCGKSTLAKTLMGKIKLSDGTIKIFSEHNICNPSLDLRKTVFYISQDVYSAFDDNQLVESSLKEVLKLTKKYNKCSYKSEIEQALWKFDLDVSYLRKKIKHLSGGERQRLALSRAYIINPGFIIFDESLDSLDMILKYQVINRIIEWKEERKFSAMFVSHDLNLIKYCCDTVIVMYKGEIMEIIENSSFDIDSAFIHPYTKNLLMSSTYHDLNITSRMTKQTETKYGTCLYADTCFYATEICRKEKPVLKQKSIYHWIACHKSHDYKFSDS